MPTSLQMMETGQGSALPEALRQPIRSGIREKYRDVAATAQGLFRYPTGREGALLLGYDAALVAALPEAVLTSFCGVGNPFTIAPIAPGAAILDVGCGAGFDMVVASRLSGPTGYVYGVDLSHEMAVRARANLALTGTLQAEVQVVDDERLPFADTVFDAVISNGVINLSPDKPRLFDEIFRVLKPGGRVQFADMILEKPLPPHLADSIASWSQ